LTLSGDFEQAWPAPAAGPDATADTASVNAAGAARFEIFRNKSEAAAYADITTPPLKSVLVTDSTEDWQRNAIVFFHIPPA